MCLIAETLGRQDLFTYFIYILSLRLVCGVCVCVLRECVCLYVCEGGGGWRSSRTALASGHIFLMSWFQKAKFLSPEKFEGRWLLGVMDASISPRRHDWLIAGVEWRAPHPRRYSPAKWELSLCWRWISGERSFCLNCGCHMNTRQA